MVDDGLRWVDDPCAAHRTCARLSSGHVRDLLRPVKAVPPGSLTVDDRRVRFDWSFSVAQLEVSDTAVLDQRRRARGPSSRPPSTATLTSAAPNASTSW